MSVDFIGDLPRDLGTEILKMLPQQDRATCLYVSGKWRKIAKQDCLWPTIEGKKQAKSYNTGLIFRMKRAKQWTENHVNAYTGKSDFTRQNVNTIDTMGQTPMHLAAKMGHVQAVRLLLKLGACPDVLDKRKRTPIQLAMTYGHNGVVTALRA